MAALVQLACDRFGRLDAQRDRIALDPRAIARAMAFAIKQPPEVDMGEIVVRSTAQA